MQNNEKVADDIDDPQHQAIHRLMEHVDERLSEVTLSQTSQNTFLGAAALYRCNRLLRSVDNAVDHGFGDTVGGNVRTLYETWLLGHLILLGGEEEIQTAWAAARNHSDRLMHDLGEYVDEPLTYPVSMPPPAHDISTRARAVALGKRLEINDPEFTEMPELWYTSLYRITSHTASHASINTIAPSIVRLDGNDAAIGLNGQNQDCDRDVHMAAYITGYFASHVFARADLGLTDLHAIRRELVNEDPSEHI